MFAMIGLQESLPIILIIVVLFGAKKLPELGRSLGQGLKEFKSSTREALDDDNTAKTDESAEKQSV